MSAEAERFTALLKSLSLGNTPAAQEGLQRLFAELQECYEEQERVSPPEFVGEQDEELRNACRQASILFVARVLFFQDKPDAHASGCSISTIVSAAGINLLDFFREVNVVVSKLSAYFEAHGSSSKLFCQAAHLKENSEMVVVLGLLAKKFKDNFEALLPHLDYYKQVVLRLGWLAFLVLRVKLLGPFPDVVSCVELLPCVFAVLVSHAPRLPDCLKRITREQRSDLLRRMAEMCKADAVRVQARMPGVEALLSQILCPAVPEWQAAQDAAKSATVAAADSEHNLDLIANPILSGLVTDIDRMNLALAALERVYEQHLACSGSELDEREFLTTDFTKFASPRYSPGQMHYVLSTLRGGSTPIRPGILLGPGAHRTAPQQPMRSFPVSAGTPGLHSPLPGVHCGDPGPPITPVSELMSASTWLRGLATTLTAEPSCTLQRFLAAVPVSVAQAGTSLSAAEQLSRRIRELISLVIPDESSSTLLGSFPLQPRLAAERRMEAYKLYLHSLETLLVAEEKVNGLAGVVALLSSSKFHRGLVACTVEIVAACYRMVSCAFPKVMDVLHIKAFDLAKMVQGFVRSVSSLPRELKRHMFLIEEKILESLAWEPGSSLYFHIVNHQSESISNGEQQGASAGTASGGTPAAPASTTPDGISAAGPSGLPPLSPKRSRSTSVWMSPAKKARGMDGAPCATPVLDGPLPTCIGSPASSNVAGPLQEFCRKVLKLIAYRLALLCEKFDFSPLGRAEVNSKVYETIEHALYHHTQMFYNRHIDQVMLSALYGYCKVHKLVQVSFREIIAQYRKQPHAQQATFRSVVIEQSNPGLQITSRADIISFYNQIFVPAMKAYLLKGVSSGQYVPGPDMGSVGGPDGKFQAAHQSQGVEHASSGSLSPSKRSTGSGSNGGALVHVTEKGIASSAPLQSSEGTKPAAQRSRASAERRIPDGLAALLQALDSQSAPDGMDMGGSSPSGEGPHAPLCDVPSGSGVAPSPTGDAAGKDVATSAGNSLPISPALTTGRQAGRQRTPIRRYGAN
uniref:Retinoblastoma-like protein n=1 Tax=Gonium pectorale TaxID=33097 RepID=N0DU64_GONPE|nr:retinoblastoma-like protein [Gonium pectorale]BAN18531.1 retinoblastoma-like protein [Gonium pectorale]BAU61598.1 retinoblastoma-like protein [Gonium pectorale]